MTPRPDPSDSQEEHRRMTIRQTVHSVGASFFGVQSSKNRERDFSRGNPLAFLIVALAMTAVVCAVLYGLVQLVLHLASP